ncbi:MAG: hypothetical protein GY731_08200, partial [Gammaproteobacteria bacterium]|nr:hypothetical protein [Gammaproteobacteria bacterium]
MLTPKEIHDKAQRLWRNGRVLRARLGIEELFPLEIPAGRPTAARLMNGYAEVRTWKEALEARCKCRRGYGYRIEYADLNHRQLGHQRLPRRIIFDGVEDLIAYLGRQAEVGRFARLLSAVLERQPALKIWIEAHPLKLLEYG